MNVRGLGILVFALGLTSALAAAPDVIASRSATVDGLSLHYLEAGKGEALVLLHGYAETSLMWRPVMPVFAERFRVIAPDLPGIGQSAIPQDGIDMKTSAIRIHALVKSLGVTKARVVGHDIGLMVAYAYAAMFPSEVEKLVLMDAFLPGVEGWEPVYNNPAIWHFRFYGPTPDALVVGRERIFFDRFWNDFAADKAHSIPEADRVAYTAEYSAPGRMHAGFEYFRSFPRTATDFAELAKTPLPMPLLTIGGKQSLGDVLVLQGKAVAKNATSVVIPDCGHWILEEKPKETTEALRKFL